MGLICSTFWLRQGAKGVTLSVCPSVRLSGTNLSKTLNLHSSFSHYVSLRSVSGQSQVSVSSLTYFVLLTLTGAQSVRMYVACGNVEDYAQEGSKVLELIERLGDIGTF